MMLTYSDVESKSDLASIIEQVKDVFDNHFDRTWFGILLDDLPIDFRTLRDIRNMLAVHSPRPEDEKTIELGIRQLEQLIVHIRQFLLPVIKEKLGLSPFTGIKMQWDETQYLIRKFVLYTFPHNLERLEALTAELRTCFHLEFSRPA
jgi:hypothetical protein